MEEEKESIAKIISQGVLNNAKSVLAILLVPIILIFLMMLAVPANLLFSTSNDIAQSAEDVGVSTQRHFYDNIGQNEREQIIEIINNTYNLSLSEKDTYNVENNGFQLLNSSCSLDIRFIPNSSSMKTCIAAYTNAVDSTIFELTKTESANTESIFEMNDIVSFDDEGNICIDEAVLKLANSENIKIDEYEYFLCRYKVFVLDYENIDRWNISIEMKENWIVDRPGSTTEEQVIVNGPVGKIEIYIYYDLSQYRIGELKNTEKMLYEEEDAVYYDAEKANQMVANTLYKNYTSYFYMRECEDNRNQLFSKLLNQGYMITVPISGLNSEYLCIETGESKMIDNIVSGSRDDIWNRIASLRNNGTLSLNATRYNCTEFANYWFYSLYGKGYVLTGDGCVMVDRLMSTEFGKQHFKKSYSPAAGAIFSISSLKGKGGHVGCVDGVDFENMTITISHANYGGAGAIILRQTMTFSQFTEMVNGFGDGATVIFAVPLSETFENENCLFANLQTEQ